MFVSISYEAFVPITSAVNGFVRLRTEAGEIPMIFLPSSVVVMPVSMINSLPSLIIPIESLSFCVSDIWITMSIHSFISTPSIDTILSPGRIPAAWAGDPAPTSLISVVTAVPTKNMPDRIRIASATFINEPATRIIARIRAGFFSKDLESSESPSSPSIAQNPPIGKILREYWVSPRFFLKKAGPIPRANSFTLTPDSLAATKWPSSCTKISMHSIIIV
jgi:hypothetical protein